MYGHIKISKDYPDNLIAAIGLRTKSPESIKEINDAIASEFLNAADDRYRKVITRYFKDNANYTEIAKELGGMTPSRVGQIVHYALAKIRKVLNAQHYHYKSISGANQHVADFVKFSEENDDGKTHQWRYTKPGGNSVLIAIYDYESRILTIYS